MRYSSSGFTQIRLVWVGDLGTWPKNKNKIWFGPFFLIFTGEFFGDVG
jgi:hypothetical protein